MNHRLYSRSIEIILENQSVWGSYIASPSFPNYHYSWLRDGSYIAYAMDQVGQHESADSFYRWVGSTIRRYANKVDDIENTLQKGQKLHPDQVLHTRFTLDGHEGVIDKTWGNFQIDGYGSWLWGLSEHVRSSGDDSILKELVEPIQTTIRFLRLTWRLPNYDCWEEFPEYVHPYTLGCVCGGLDAINSLVNEGRLSLEGEDLTRFSTEVHSFIKKNAVVQGKFVKYLDAGNKDEPVHAVPESGVDASLIGLAYPYKVFGLDDPVMQATLKEIEDHLLRKDGGVYRYLGDVYYGGGEWILLSAWLGWTFIQTGQKEKAEKLLHWIEAQADRNLYLPEQVSEHTLFPNHRQPWLEKWGPVANPLLWSHAMYLILYKNLQEK